jgi:hypothetical protein
MFAWFSLVLGKENKICKIFSNVVFVKTMSFKMMFFSSLICKYSGLELLRDPRYNKGLAFSYEERKNHYLEGLLPPSVFTQEMQVMRLFIAKYLIFCECIRCTFFEFQLAFHEA